MRSAVRVHDAVAKEVTVARHVFAEVAAISIIFFSVCILDKKTLVNPVPDITALEVRVFVDRFPLVPKVTGRVTHRMGIFGRCNRTVAAFLAYLFQPFCARILRDIHVGVPFPLCTFVVDRTTHHGLFLIFYIQVSLVEVITVSGFVAQRPDGYGRMVLVAFVHVHRTVHVRFQPFRVVA